LAAPVVKPELPNGPRLSSGGSFLFRHVYAVFTLSPPFGSPFSSSSAVTIHIHFRIPKVEGDAVTPVLHT
jgi:hypothetical protein